MSFADFGLGFPTDGSMFMRALIGLQPWRVRRIGIVLFLLELISVLVFSVPFIYEI